jgi:hypothetical protein
MALLPLERVRGGLLSDPSVYPQTLDLAREAILFLRLNRDALQSASFLDDRILTPQLDGRWVRLTELAPWMEGAHPPRPLHFIFHAGHVGSTLISRLLEEAGGVLGLREPLALRVLADAADQAAAPHALASGAQIEMLLRWFAVLWSRGYADTKTVVLKANSSAGRLAPALLALTPAARAIYVNLKAEPYLATLLSGENSYLDLRGHGGERYKRLARLAGPPATPLHAMSLGEIAALTWLVETLTQCDAQRVHGNRVLPLDFDAFLAEPAAVLRSVCTHFDMAAPEQFYAGARHSRALQRYSKAPERPYTPEFRSQLLAQSRAGNAAEIRKGLTWLEAYAQRSPAVASALSA